MLQNLAAGILNLMLYPPCVIWATMVRVSHDPMQDPVVIAYFAQFDLDSADDLG